MEKWWVLSDPPIDERRSICHEIDPYRRRVRDRRGRIPGVGSARSAAAALRNQQEQNVPTPRTADGHPDLSGFWGGGGGGGVKPDEKGNIVQLTAARLCHQTQIDAGECHPGVNAERDAGMNQRPANQPMYKPEFWTQVQHYDREGIQLDPAFHCKPNGVPRMGPRERSSRPRPS